MAWKSGPQRNASGIPGPRVFGLSAKGFRLSPVVEHPTTHAPEVSGYEESEAESLTSFFAASPGCAPCAGNQHQHIFAMLYALGHYHFPRYRGRVARALPAPSPRYCAQPQGKSQGKGKGPVDNFCLSVHVLVHVFLCMKAQRRHRSALIVDLFFLSRCCD